MFSNITVTLSFSLITASAIYALGRRIANHRTGALALALYAVLPLAFFYERMAMADPLAAGLAALVAWRSLSFARRPTLRAGIVLGGLLAMASLAKLTMGLLPLLHYTYSAINPVAVKSLMKAVGLPAGSLRKPLTNLEGEALMKGVRIVQQLGLDKKYGWKVKPVSAIAAE